MRQVVRAWTPEFGDYTWYQVLIEPENSGTGWARVHPGLTASADVTDAALAVICFGANDDLLGFTYTNLLQNLTGGERKGFATVSDTPPLAATQCVGVEGYAEDTGF